MAFFRDPETGNVTFTMPPEYLRAFMGEALKEAGALSGRRSRKASSSDEPKRRNRYNHFIKECKDICDFDKYPNSKLEGCEALDAKDTSGKNRLKRAGAIWKQMSQAQKAEWKRKADEWNAANLSGAEQAEASAGKKRKEAESDDEEEDAPPAKKPLTAKAKAKAEPPAAPPPKNSLFMDDDDDDDGGDFN